jgi:hypothetical protein
MNNHTWKTDVGNSVASAGVNEQLCVCLADHGSTSDETSANQSQEI